MSLNLYHKRSVAQARLHLFALAYNLGNPGAPGLIKIGAKVVRPAKYVTFQMAEVAVPRESFAARSWTASSGLEFRRPWFSVADPATEREVGDSDGQMSLLCGNGPESSTRRRQGPIDVSPSISASTRLRVWLVHASIISSLTFEVSSYRHPALSPIYT